LALNNSFVLRSFQTNPIGAEELFSANRIGGEKLNFADFLKCICICIFYLQQK